MTVTPPLPFASASLKLCFAPKFIYIYTPIHRSSPISSIRMCGVSAIPDKKTGPKRTRQRTSSSRSSEDEDLVRSIIRSFTDKQPLVNTLNKYVKFVRTEHCFLLFEELGKSDRWLQCLEFLKNLLPVLVILFQYWLRHHAQDGLSMPWCGDHRFDLKQIAFRRASQYLLQQHTYLKCLREEGQSPAEQLTLQLFPQTE